MRAGKSNNGVNFPAQSLRLPNASGKIVTPSLRIFTLNELESATRNFSLHSFLGEGGFGHVFKGWIDENTFKPSRVGVGIPVAVKKSKPDSVQGLEEWQVCFFFPISNVPRSRNPSRNSASAIEPKIVSWLP